jgi:hypothetical protein
MVARVRAAVRDPQNVSKRTRGRSSMRFRASNGLSPFGHDGNRVCQRPTISVRHRHMDTMESRPGSMVIQPAWKILHPSAGLIRASLVHDSCITRIQRHPSALMALS